MRIKDNENKNCHSECSDSEVKNLFQVVSFEL